MKSDMLEDALEQFREDQIRRRFGELIAGPQSAIDCAAQSAGSVF
jgi:hypothetical protein